MCNHAKTATYVKRIVRIYAMEALRPMEVPTQRVLIMTNVLVTIQMEDIQVRLLSIHILYVQFLME